MSGFRFNFALNYKVKRLEHIFCSLALLFCRSLTIHLVVVNLVA
jgi:hypothetical protein